MGSYLGCEGLERFATAPQSSRIMPAKKFHVQRTVDCLQRIVADLSGIGSALFINLTVPQPSSDTVGR
jgi:hypothetical protein